MDAARENGSFKRFYYGEGSCWCGGDSAFSAPRTLIENTIASLVFIGEFDDVGVICRRARVVSQVTAESCSSCVLFAVNAKGGHNAQLIYGLARR
jgi:hypothetical protein